MGRKVSNGRSVKVTVPENTTIEQGKFYLIDGFLGMAVQSVTTEAGETAEVVLTIEKGEYETSQINTSEAFAIGAKVYYDITNKQFTTTAAGNRFAGVVTVAKDADNVIWFNFMSDSAEIAAKGFVTFVIPGALTAGAGKVANFIFNKAVTITKVKARVLTLPGATTPMSFDVNKGASSLFAAVPSIASTDTAGSFKEFTPDADPAQNVFDTIDILSVDIDDEGSTAAADLEIIVEFDQSI